MNALDRTDAVTAHLLEIDRMLRRIGHATEIYAQYATRDLDRIRRPLAGLGEASADLLLFHFAGYTEFLDAVARFPGPRGVIYHNVTPAHFFDGMEESRRFCAKGRTQVAALRNVFDFGIAVSEFNRRELEKAGLARTTVLPISFDLSGLSGAKSSRSVLDRYGGGAANLLVVGRIAPHKGILEAVRAFDLLLRRYGDARLLLVGRVRGYDKYVRTVREEIARLGLDRHVILAGEVSIEDLRAYYETAGALLVLSEHEGFCVPLIEAMSLDVPVVAFPSCAVAETMGDAGVRLPGRDPTAVADALEKVLSDRPFREAVLEKQRARREAFRPQSVERRLSAVLNWARSLGAVRAAARPKPSFSVVVCTYNRATVLETCLAALRNLDYPAYEVVVVNGPSTEGTTEILSRFPDIKRVSNDTRNLSISRNLGIVAASGDVIAFIDDDAVPDPDWLSRLADAYADPRTGAAGGKVYGPGGDHLQFNNGLIARYGMPRAIQKEPDDRNEPGGDWYNILMGTNSSFRRDVLDEIGGFAENYEYYHDESDLCVRVIRAGYRVVHVPEAKVWHEFEKSHVRKTLRDVNWRVIAKNTIYFYFKNNRWWVRPFDAIQPMRAAAVLLGSFARWFFQGEISAGLFVRSLGRWIAGCFLGYGKGLFRRPRRFLARRSGSGRAPFLPFNGAQVLHVAERMHVALVSQQYPPDRCGGIGVYTEQLARGLTAAGHRVSVIAKGDRESAVWRDGVLVYRIPKAAAGPLPPSYRVVRKNLGRSYAAHRLLTRLHRDEGLRIVESPLWDAEAFVTAIDGLLPLVIRLNTPMAMAIETQGWKRTDDLALASEMEWAMLERADGWVDTSGSIVETFRRRSWIGRGGAPVREIPFGVPLPTLPDRRKGPNGPVRFLFVGRLEPRKGIDVLLEAIPRLLDECGEAEIRIAGEIPGSGSIPGRFFRTCSVRDAARRVEFLGRVSDESRERLYAESDVFVAPSRYESFGIVYLEAMAHGIPVVACRAGGTAHVVRDGVTGILVEPGDSDALAGAMIRLAGNPALRRRLGDAARNRVEREYTIEQMVKRTLEFYAEIVGVGKKGCTGEQAGERAARREGVSPPLRPG